MTEYTPKLGFPIPAVTRGGDVNDVQDITDTIGQILDYIDSGTGDYLVAMASGETTEITGGAAVFGADLDVSLAVPPHDESFDDSKIGWEEDGESEYAKIDLEDITVTIKKSGVYRILLSAAWTTEATEGALALGISRTDVQGGMNQVGAYMLTESILGNLFGQALGTCQVLGWIGPHFFKEGAVVTPLLMPSEDIELTELIVGVERL